MHVLRRSSHGGRNGRLFGVLLIASFVTLSSASAQDAESVRVDMKPVDDSGVSGTAVLTEDGDRTVVELTMQGVVGEHPDHIHRSTCADPEPDPTYPLTDVVLNQADERGRSRTTVDVPLRELLEEPYVILVHKSHEEIDIYLSCGDIVDTRAKSSGDAAAASTPATGREAAAMPATGVGWTAMNGAWAAATLAAGSLAALLAAVRSRRKQV